LAKANFDFLLSQPPAEAGGNSIGVNAF